LGIASLIGTVTGVRMCVVVRGVEFVVGKLSGTGCVSFVWGKFVGILCR